MEDCSTDALSLTVDRGVCQISRDIVQAECSRCLPSYIACTNKTGSAVQHGDIPLEKLTLLFDFSTFAPSSLVEDTFTASPATSDGSLSASDFDKLPDDVLDTPRFNGVYLLRVDMCC